MKKIFAVVICFCLMLSVFCGCSGYKTSKKYVIPENPEKETGKEVYSDDSYSLSFESETFDTFLENKSTGKIWATTPYDFYNSGETTYSLSSDLIINYYDFADNSIQTQKSYECVEMDAASCTLKDGVISHTYHFSEAEISITLNIAFKNGVLKIYFNTDDIVESGATKLVSVGIAPNLCAVANTDSKDSYLFVPTGSGALMYCDASVDGITRTYSGEVYGSDYSVDKLDNPGNETAVRLPVFGVKDGNDAIMGIITKGEGNALIEANSGNIRTGYSSVYSSFYVRGYNNSEWNSGKNRGTELANDVLMLDDEMAKSLECCVDYYCLSGDNANYVGMADVYRKYLLGSDMLKKSDETQKLYNVTFVGGASVKETLLGFPHNSVEAISTYSQTKKMLSYLLETGFDAPNVLLKGYGLSGVNVGKIAGGYDFSSVLGGKKGQKSVVEYCEKENIGLYNDFDIVRFSKSANGFNTSFDIAQSANGETAKNYSTKINVRTDDDNYPRYLLLKREQLSDAAELITEKLGNYISGVSLSSFGSISYSDFSNDNYKLKNNYVKQSKKIAKTLKNSNRSVMYSDANAYCAGICDCITDVPLNSGRYDAFDERIPFYEIVYKGYIPLYSSAVNSAADADELWLNAVETGVSPSFTLGYKIDTTLVKNSEKYFYSIKFSNNKSLIEKYLNSYKDYFSSIADATVKNHIILGNGVTETVFDNGVSVIVNRSNEDVVIDGKSVKSCAFLYFK